MNKFFGSRDFIKFCYSVFDELPIPIDILDHRGKLIYINKSFALFLNKEREEIINKKVQQVEPTSKFMEVLSSKKANIAQKHVFSNNREAIVHRIPIIDEEGEVIGGFGMVLFEGLADMQETLQNLKKAESELKMYKNEIAKLNRAKYTIEEIIGTSEALKKAKSNIRKFAKVQSSVLITGESGVGKELFAHSIHNESPRKNGPFIGVNCSAIPENLMESEFFGYEEGSFTGAKKGGNIGKFQLANGGTIFLDEIADMPMHMQAKLLRVLQEKEVQPIGSKAPISIDVRVVCATHKNLEEKVKNGEFREDLYYRLNVLTLHVPSLRERKEDIPLLIEMFLNNFYKETGMLRKVPENVMEILCAYKWPGNVRELRNIVEKICVSADQIFISLSDIPPEIISQSFKARGYGGKAGLHEIVNALEREVIISALQEAKYNKSFAAKILNIPRATLYRKLEDYGIEVD